ncbi:MAG: S1-C subfamily serine protease, partial [Gammaproteobacteria bacterium]
TNDTPAEEAAEETVESVDDVAELIEVIVGAEVIEVPVVVGFDQPIPGEIQAIRFVLEGSDIEAATDSLGRLRHAVLSTGVAVAPSQGGFLGVYLADSDQGLRIDRLVDDSAAVGAGLQAGDIIRKLDGEDVKTADDFRRLMTDKAAGTRVFLKVTRGEMTVHLSADLGARPEEFAVVSEDAPIALEVPALSEHGSFEIGEVATEQLEVDLREALEALGYAGSEEGVQDLEDVAVYQNFEIALTPQTAVSDEPGFLGVYLDDTAAGLQIQGLVENTAASRIGLQAGDIIRSLNGVDVANADDFRRLMADLSVGDGVSLLVAQGDNVQYILSTNLGSRPAEGEGQVSSPVEVSQRLRLQDIGYANSDEVDALSGLGTIEVTFDSQDSASDQPGFLGVYLSDTDRGLNIDQLVDDSAAVRAGLKAGDIIRMFNGMDVANADDLRARIAEVSAGMAVSLVVSRGDEVLHLSTHLGTRPAEEGEQAEVPVEIAADLRALRALGYLGADEEEQQHAYASDERGFLGVQLEDSDDGLRITRVIDGTVADGAGLEEGDIIRSLDGHEIDSSGEFLELMSSHPVGSTIELTLSRGETTIHMVASLGSRPEESDAPAGLPGMVTEEIRWTDLGGDSEPVDVTVDTFAEHHGGDAESELHNQLLEELHRLQEGPRQRQMDDRDRAVYEAHEREAGRAAEEHEVHQREMHQREASRAAAERDLYERQRIHGEHMLRERQAEHEDQERRLRDQAEEHAHRARQEQVEREEHTHRARQEQSERQELVQELRQRVERRLERIRGDMERRENDLENDLNHMLEGRSLDAGARVRVQRLRQRLQSWRESNRRMLDRQERIFRQRLRELGR